MRTPGSERERERERVCVCVREREREREVGSRIADGGGTWRGGEWVGGWTDGLRLGRVGGLVGLISSCSFIEIVNKTGCPLRGLGVDIMVG